MWWRVPRAQFIQNKGERNREALKSMINAGKTPGILAYALNEPVGWCAVAPREEYPTLERSRLLKRVDDKRVWSVVCFFIAKKFRHKGITTKLLHAVVEFVRVHDGKTIEGYPVDPRKKLTPDPFAYTGLMSSFRKAGFMEVTRRSYNRPIMRFEIE